MGIRRCPAAVLCSISELDSDVSKDARSLPEEASCVQGFKIKEQAECLLLEIYFIA